MAAWGLLLHCVLLLGMVGALQDNLRAANLGKQRVWVRVSSCLFPSTPLPARVGSAADSELRSARSSELRMQPGTHGPERMPERMADRQIECQMKCQRLDAG